MAKLIVYPKMKSWNGSVVNASGTLETYIAGTSTGKITYTDSAEGTPNGYPGDGGAEKITFDANGEANVWLKTDEAYKFVFKDSSGTIIDTFDNVVPISSFTSLSDNLDVNGKSIISSANGDIPVTPNNTGSVILDGLSWPQADGTNGQTIITDGAGQLSFSTAGTDIVNDTTPQLGGDLDTNTYNISFDTTKGIKDENGNEQVLFTTAASAVNYVNITNAATDGSPIIAAAGSDSDINLNLSGYGTGGVKLSNLLYPTTDGTAGQSIITDGAGTLSFSTAGGILVQHQQASSITRASVTSLIPYDDTKPQNTEGDELLTLSITPSSASNTLVIDCVVPVVFTSSATLHYGIIALFQDSTANALNAGACALDTDSGTGTLRLRHIMTAGTAASTTFKIRGGTSNVSHNADFLGSGSGRVFGGAASMTLTIREYQ